MGSEGRKIGDEWTVNCIHMEIGNVFPLEVRFLVNCLEIEIIPRLKSSK
jgi:hypothetical protein